MTDQDGWRITRVRPDTSARSQAGRYGPRKGGTPTNSASEDPEVDAPRDGKSSVRVMGETLLVLGVTLAAVVGVAALVWGGDWLASGEPRVKVSYRPASTPTTAIERDPLMGLNAQARARAEGVLASVSEVRPDTVAVTACSAKFYDSWNMAETIDEQDFAMAQIADCVESLDSSLVCETSSDRGTICGNRGKRIGSSAITVLAMIAASESD